MILRTYLLITLWAGTDSRVGFGFRLGPNADFQVQFEIGPQENTQAIGPDAAGTNKREVWAFEETSNKVPTTWLEKWKQQQSEVPEESESDTEPQTYVDEDVINHLSQLYKKKLATSE